MARMHDERGTADVGQQVADVNAVERADEAYHILRRNRHALHVDEPTILLRLAVGDKHRRIDLAERRIVAPPAELDKFEHGLGFVDILLRWVALELAPHISAIQNKVTYALRMTGSISDRHRSSLAATKKNESLQVCSFDDGLQVGNKIVERQAFGILIGETAAPTVIARKGVIGRQLGEARLPDGALRVVFNVVEPSCDLDHRRTATALRIGNTHTVWGLTEANLCHVCASDGRSHFKRIGGP